MFFHVTQPQPLDLEIISIHVGIGLTIFNIINKHISLNFETQHSFQASHHHHWLEPEQIISFVHMLQDL